MTPPPTGRHRAGTEPPPEAQPEPDGRHRAGPRHSAVPVRRPWRAAVLVVTAALAAGVGPLVPGLLAGSDRGTSRIASDGAPDSLPGGSAPSPSSRPADEGLDGSTQALRPVVRTTVPRSGPGTFRVALARSPEESADDGVDVAPEVDGSADLTYTVEIEDGLPFTPQQTASTVDRVLADARGWEPVTGLQLRRTTEEPDFRVLVASPETTDLLCFPLETNGQVSCRNGDLVVLNGLRWARGIPDYAGRLGQYRTYLVNHEVGHRLGYGHVTCPGPGEPAPVMQQQTYGLEGCTRNAWPEG